MAASNRNLGACGTGASDVVHPARTNDPKVTSSTPNFNTSLSAARHNALLDACWDASGLYSATTVAALVDYLVSHIRQHPRYDALDLARVVRCLEGLGARQGDDATLVVGRGAVNRLLDKIVDATTPATSPPPSSMSFPPRRRDEPRCVSDAANERRHDNERTSET
jgi:hypothetical protein